MGLLDKAVSALVPMDGLFSQLFSLISEAIPDPDKRAEIAFKIINLKGQLAQVVLAQTSTPKIDAFVKLLAAVGTWGQVFKDLTEGIVSLVRPLGSLALSGYAIYAANHGIEIPAGLDYIFAAAFPGWMASRHVGKQNEVKAETIREGIKAKEMAKTRSLSDLEEMMQKVREGG